MLIFPGLSRTSEKHTEKGKRKVRVDLKPLQLLRQPVFLAVALSHFAVDVFNGQTGILLAVLSLPLGLTNATIGLIATIYAVVGSLSQPLFGWLTDRHGGRWAAAGGVGLMGGASS